MSQRRTLRDRISPGAFGVLVAIAGFLAVYPAMARHIPWELALANGLVGLLAGWVAVANERRPGPAGTLLLALAMLGPIVGILFLALRPQVGMPYLAGVMMAFGVERAFGYRFDFRRGAPAADPERLKDLEARVDDIEAAVRKLTRAQFDRLALGPRERSKSWAWNGDSAFWYADSGRYRATTEEEWALTELNSRIMAALAFLLTGKELDTASSRRDYEAKASTAIEHATRGKGWGGVARIWNASCAALLRERLEPPLRSDLEAQWIAVMGRPIEVNEPHLPADASHSSMPVE
jgi:hypothetical protein